jgi:hypothetical protein
MFSTHLRRVKILLALAVLTAMLFSDADPLRADEPEMVELTLMFKIPVDLFDESFPMPDGDGAIGINFNSEAHHDYISPFVYLGQSFTDEGRYGEQYVATDGEYLAAGGSYKYVSVYVKDLVLPSKGFILLKQSEISSVDYYYVTGPEDYQYELAGGPIDPATWVLVIFHGTFKRV